MKFPQVLRSLKKKKKLEDEMARVFPLVPCWPLPDPQPHLGDVTKRLTALSWALSSFGRYRCCLSFYEELTLSRSYRVIIKNRDSGAGIRRVS